MNLTAPAHYIPLACHTNGRRYPCCLRADGWLANIATNKVAVVVPIVIEVKGEEWRAEVEEVAARLRAMGYCVEVE